MNRLINVLTGLCIVLVFTVAAWSAEKMMMQETKAEYSADEYVNAEGFTAHSRVYRAQGKERREQDAQGMKQIMINRMDKKLTWVLMPEEKMYMEMKMGESKGQQEEPDLRDYKVDYTILGEEVVNGVNTTKSKVIVTDTKGNRFDGFMWDTKEGIMVKMDTVSKAEGKNVKMMIELKNLKIAKQDPKLFDIPSGYTKMPMPGMGNMKDMMKDMMKGGGF